MSLLLGASETDVVSSCRNVRGVGQYESRLACLVGASVLTNVRVRDLLKGVEIGLRGWCFNAD